jgi:hypothetical protein
MKYYQSYNGYRYKSLARKTIFDETTVAKKLEEDQYKDKYRPELLTILDDAKTTKAIAKKSRNAYICDVLKRTGKIFGPPAVAIGWTAAIGGEMTGAYFFGGIYAPIAKIVDAFKDNPKDGIVWTLMNMVPYYQRIVKTNEKFISKLESEVNAWHECEAERQHDYPDWVGMGP